MFNHISVLLNECIEGLNIKEDGIYVDATLGGGGHSSKILEKLNNKGMLYCFDKDQDAINAATKRLEKISSNFKIIHADFSNLEKCLKENGVEKIDGILYDIGVSSYQLDTPERGFSYQHDAPLDMRMDQTQKLSAYEVVNNYKKEALTKIFFEYGEEPFAKLISAKIVEARKIKPIETTFQLVDIIKSALPSSVLRKKGHPAKQVFQAIRIEVNDELMAIENSLKQALNLLNANGRCAVITFHSLEDRIVKNLFKKMCCVNDNVKGLASLNEIEQSFRLVSRKPIISNEQELMVNNRAHSAKLRIIEKL
ncbi:MAG: 16S rRNA (cytosine(1402)-N(4))-methyltransferase RsmH [Erysipelotrichaceae bacterium]|nr:16S rRNA (cytosine(1402)-N(4))-methyltransferase RsmH [Erysipelotrichaceae bacterium]